MANNKIQNLRLWQYTMMKATTYLFLAGLVLVLLLGGCAAPPKEVAKPIVKEVPQPPPQPQKLEELVVPLMEERKESKRLISFSVRDADIRETLLALSKTIYYNIVLDPDVSGRATVEVKRVTPLEALDALLSPLGLQYKIKGQIIHISKLKRETRIFPLNYITTKRTGTSSFSASVTARGGDEETEVGTISSEDSADLWTDIETGLKDIISTEGKVTINRMPGIVVANDYPSNLKRIAEFLEAVEGSVQRQVMIKAKLVDVILSDDFQMGLNWSAISQVSGLDVEGNLSGGKIFGQTLSPGTGVFQIALSDVDFSMLFDAMSKQGEVNILSSPQISVMNNQKAAMKVVTSEVFFEARTTVNIETGERTTEPTPKPVDIGLVLEVTPQISDNGQVMMNIHPIITEKVGESTFESADIKLTSPVLTVRETNTVVKVPDGKTIVLAGLIQEKKRETRTTVPCLGSIPVFGKLFRKTEEAGGKSELAIFLTPTILSGKKIEELSMEELKRLNLEK